MSPGHLAVAPNAPDDTEEVDARVEHLILDVVRGGRAEDADVGDSIESGYIEQTMQGASQLSVQILDQDLALLNSESLGYRINSLLDGVPFRLVQVSLADDFNVSLTFEHLVVAWLREHDKPLKVSRGSMTRAEFIRKMVREVKAGPISFVSPELHVKQPKVPVKKPKTQPHNDVTRAPGFAPGVKLTIGGQPATALQLSLASRTLDVAASLNAPPRAVLAMVCAAIGESSYREIRNLTGTKYEGVFQADPANIARDDTEGQAHYFLVGGKGFQSGGAIALSRANPGYSPGQIAYRVEGDRSNFSSDAQAANFYDRWRKEADAIIAAYSGGGGTFGGGGAHWAKYEFTRGQNGQREDSWTCMQRLANEVRWRCFVVGRRTIFYCTDDDLLKSRPRYTLDPQTTGIVSVNFDVEVGGRTVLIRGVRTPRPSQLLLRVRQDRWDCPPGAVIEMNDYGPGNGRWLVDTVRRDLFDAEAQITLRQPAKALPEPRPQLVSSSPGSIGGDVSKAQAAAQQISDRMLPYVYGGGHGSWRTAETATGLDCSSSVSLALHAGGFMRAYSGPIVSGDFAKWGDPGEGRTMTVWYNGGHVWMEFKGTPYERFDTSPQGAADGPYGPHVRPHHRSTSGFQPRHWPGT